MFSLLRLCFVFYGEIYHKMEEKQEVYLKHLPATERIQHFTSTRISKISTNWMMCTWRNKDSELMWCWPVRIDINWMITWKAQNLYPTHDTEADNSNRECWGFCIGMLGSTQVQYFPAIRILIGSIIVQTFQFMKLREIHLLTCIVYHVKSSLQVATEIISPQTGSI